MVDPMNEPDDMLPNDGGLMIGDEPSEEQEQEEMNERAMIVGAQPLLDVLFKWLQAYIDEAANVASINLESNVPVEAQVKAQQLIQAKLSLIQSTIQGMADAHGVDYTGNVK